MPTGFRSFLNRGFSDLALLPFTSVESLFDFIAEEGELNDEKAKLKCAKILRVSEDEVGKIIAAASLLIAFTTRRTDTQAVLEAGVAASAIPQESLPALFEISEKLNGRKGVYKEALELVSLAKEVAPSFERLDLSVELRFSFTDGQPLRTVPIVLCRIDTDTENYRNFFQMRKADVVRLRDQLNDALQHIEAVEQWSAK